MSDGELTFVPRRQGLYCYSCGSWLPTGAALCFHCSSPLALRTSAVSPEVGTAQGYPLPFSMSAASEAANVQPQNRQPGTRNGPPIFSTAKVDRSWSARFHRGVRLATMSLQIMREQPGLIAVPMLSVSAITLLFVGIAVVTGGKAAGPGLILYLGGFCVMATIGMLGQAVITHRVMEHLEGRRSTNGESLQAVMPRLPTIAAWASLSLTVGVALRSLERGRGILGILSRIVAIVAVISWSAMTFFVLPIIVFEGLSTGAAIRRSKELLRATWGEGVVGVGALNIIFNLALWAVLAIAILLAALHAVVLALLVILIAIIGFNLLAAVASPIFTVALYRYATTGEAVLGFAQADFAASFRPRARRFSRALA